MNEKKSLDNDKDLDSDYRLSLHDRLVGDSNIGLIDYSDNHILRLNSRCVPVCYYRIPARIHKNASSWSFCRQSFVIVF